MITYCFNSTWSKWQCSPTVHVHESSERQLTTGRIHTPSEAVSQGALAAPQLPGTRSTEATSMSTQRMDPVRQHPMDAPWAGSSQRCRPSPPPRPCRVLVARLQLRQQQRRGVREGLECLHLAPPQGLALQPFESLGIGAYIFLARGHAVRLGCFLFSCEPEPLVFLLRRGRGPGPAHSRATSAAPFLPPWGHPWSERMGRLEVSHLQFRGCDLYIYSDALPAPPPTLLFPSFDPAPLSHQRPGFRSRRPLGFTPLHALEAHALKSAQGRAYGRLVGRVKGHIMELQADMSVCCV